MTQYSFIEFLLNNISTKQLYSTADKHYGFAFTKHCVILVYTASESEAV
jgi:hypothetical protein